MAGSYAEVMFVRHGEADHVLAPNVVAGRSDDSKLTETGIRQAELLGEFWRQRGFSLQYADISPLRRCRQTARTALDTLRRPGIRTMLFNELSEQCLGKNEGRQRNEVYTPDILADISHLGASYAHPGYNAEGVPGESLQQVATRMTGYLAMRSRIAAVTLPAKCVTVAFSHHVAVKAMLARLELGILGAEANPHELHDAFMRQPKLEPCSQTLIIAEEIGNWSFAAEYVGASVYDLPLQFGNKFVG